MNPIEHVWDALGRRVAGRQLPPQTLQELETSLLEEWDRIPHLVINSLIDSMPQSSSGTGLRPLMERISSNFLIMPFKALSDKADAHEELWMIKCTTSREDRQIVCITVTDCSVTSRAVAQHIESLMHHSVSARTIRCHLQQSGLSARRPLLRLPLTQNHRRLRRQWCDERRMRAAEWNEAVFTDESRFCLQHHDGRIRV
ncbi:transposable element Tcb1 transposase [Trichonephila clavipes]|nr:transposable element Tcb1 transposase [Trichonephila clavipes]